MITFTDIMEKPVLTKERIKLAYAIAIIADVLEFPITGAEMTILGAPGGEAAASFLDCVVMVAMTKLLGFHWVFVPSFLVEIVPGLDLLPTWVGCVAFVVWQRKKDQAQPAPLPAVIDVEDITAVSDRPTGRLTAPPSLLPEASDAIQAQVPPPPPDNMVKDVPDSPA
jgi:hypothetical protein